MTAAGIKLADANVWFAHAADAHQHHARAREWFDEHSQGVVIEARICSAARIGSSAA